MTGWQGEGDTDYGFGPGVTPGGQYGVPGFGSTGGGDDSQSAWSSFWSRFNPRTWFSSGDGTAIAQKLGLEREWAKAQIWLKGDRAVPGREFLQAAMPRDKFTALTREIEGRATFMYAKSTYPGPWGAFAATLWNAAADERGLMVDYNGAAPQAALGKYKKLNSSEKAVIINKLGKAVEDIVNAKDKIRDKATRVAFGMTWLKLSPRNRQTIGNSILDAAARTARNLRYIGDRHRKHVKQAEFLLNDAVNRTRADMIAHNRRMKARGDTALAHVVRAERAPRGSAARRDALNLAAQTVRRSIGNILT